MPARLPLKERESLTAVAHDLLLNGSYLQPNGLCHGKMGIVIYLFACGKLFDKMEYTDYAFSLLEQILSEEFLAPGNDMGFENGIPGIGAATMRLIQAGYFEADIHEMMQPVDSRVYRQASLLNQAADISPAGAIGAGFYLLERLQHLEDPALEWEKLIAIEHLLLVTEYLAVYLNTAADHPATYQYAGIKIILETASLEYGYRDYAREKLQPFVNGILAGKYANMADMTLLLLTYEIAASFKHKELLTMADHLSGVLSTAPPDNDQRGRRILINRKLYALSKQPAYKSRYNSLMEHTDSKDHAEKGITWSAYRFTEDLAARLATLDKYTDAFGIFEEYAYLYH